MNVVTSESVRSASFTGAPPPVMVIYEYKHICSNKDIRTYVGIGTNGTCTIIYGTAAVGVTGSGTLLYLTSE
jgi:hypothetical protein